MLERLAAIGEKATRIRKHFERPEYDEIRGVPPLVRAALDNLREVAIKRFEADADAETRIVEVLARAAQEMKKT